MTRVRWQDLERTPLFEDMVAVMISRLHPKAERIDGIGGDGGRDIQLREDGRLDLFELKSFTGRVTAHNPNRRKQVEDSLKTAAELAPDSWSMVVPINHSPGELKWFDDLRSRYKFPLYWMGRDWLDQTIASFPDIRRYYLEGARDEVIDLLKELNAEQGEVGGIEVGMARWTALQQRISAIDPQYDIQIVNGPAEAAAIAFPNAVLYKEQTIEGRPVTVCVVPKYRNAERDRPIRFSVTGTFPNTEVGREEAERFKLFVEYGDPVEVSPEHVITTQIDAPGGVGGDLGPGHLRISSTPIDPLPAFAIRLIVRDEGGSHLAAIPIQITHRHVGNVGMTIRGQDPSQSVKVTLRLNPADHRLNMDITTVPAETYLPGAILPALRLVRQLRAPNQVLLTIDGRELAPPQPVPDMNLVSDAFVVFVEQVARVQAETGTSFYIPNGVDAEHVRDIHQIIRLLDGETISIKPGPTDVQMTQDPPDEWRTAPGQPVSIAIQSESHMTAMGEEIPLGMCSLMMISMSVEVLHNDRPRIRIAPLPDSRAYLRRGTDINTPPPDIAPAVGG